MSCPHCDGPARTRHSRRHSALYRELRYQCIDVDCGATFRADLVITHTISPSARPNPAVHLPLWRPGVHHNDNGAAAAAHGG